MGVDDDADCEHVWGLAELHLTLEESAAAYVCVRCGIPAYDDLTPSSTRPKL